MNNIYIFPIVRFEMLDECWSHVVLLPETRFSGSRTICNFFKNIFRMIFLFLFQILHTMSIQLLNVLLMILIFTKLLTVYFLENANKFNFKQTINNYNLKLLI